MGIFALFRSPVAGLLLAAAFAIAASPAQADPPRPAKASIGAITFNHDPYAWRFEPDGDGLVATCLSVDCRGVVIDISRRPSEGACTRQFVFATAQEKFPQADRHAVNTLAAGRFGLVLAASRRGPDFGVPTYVFACLDWQGIDYRFAMRPETVGETSWTGGALHYLVSRASAPPPLVDRLKIGAMTLAIPTDVWTIAALVPARVAMLTCRPPTCPDSGPGLIVSATAEGETPDEPPSIETDRWSGRIRTDVFTGPDPDALTFTIETTHSPCRNYVPPQVVASVRQGGITYRIASPAPGGCRSGWGVSPRAFEALLASAKIAAAP